ncbi:esterase [Vallicoccus soli]|uniref:Esterase n=1 Tax=Vallicoccus soli TaxID=2339232 RepID=A0A3A3Z6L7_9ACTN|nr:esterase [Vallicoccus soli]
MTRRALLTGGAGLLVGGAAVVGADAATGGRLRGRVARELADEGPAGVVPDVPQGRVRLERVRSRARGREVGLWTAAPHGHGDGAGLPVVLVLHGASATTADLERFGFARFLTAAVRDGAPPFVLAGADGGRTRWEGDGAADDPQRMLAEELPGWCAERGFDAGRAAAYGWSMGGYGALRALALRPGGLRAVAALSPAVARDDALLEEAATLDGRRVGLWCGTADPLLPAVQELAERVGGGGPAVAAWAPGAHRRRYWDRVTPDALRFLAAALAVG